MLEGLPPNKAAHVMRLRCDEVTARRVADIIVETFDPADTAAAAFEEQANTRDWNQGPWIVEVYFGMAPDEAAVRALLAVAAPDILNDAVFGRVQERDWVAAALADLPAVRAGRFLLYGSHARGAVRVNDIGIEIEAALAFGTGHHGSTRGCLLMLEAVACRRRPRQILDVGTGTGVLAMAAARRWHRPVVAGDIDPVSVATAQVNARFNHAQGISFVRSDGVAHPAMRGNAPYDLVLANILARPLRKLAPALAGLLASGGEIILSGLLARDVPGVLSAYGAQRLALSRRLDIEGWATLLLQKHPGRRRSH